MKRNGIVVDTPDGKMIKIIRPDSCQKCGQCREAKEVLVPLTDEKLAAGDEVELDIKDGSIINASAIAYVVPLLFLIIGMVVGMKLPEWFGWGGNPEIYGFVSALGMMGLSLFGIKLLEPRMQKSKKFDMDIKYGKTNR